MRRKPGLDTNIRTGALVVLGIGCAALGEKPFVGLGFITIGIGVTFWLHAKIRDIRNDTAD